MKRTKISRLNYIKLILKKVSFSPLLFKKELQKGLQECTTEQLVILKRLQKAQQDTIRLTPLTFKRLFLGNIG